MRAAIAAPVIKRDHFVAHLYVHSIEPRQWSDWERSLVVTVAERTWEADERARAEQQLRISKDRIQGQKEAFQAAINGAPLSESLKALARTAEAEYETEVRTAFMTVDPDGSCMHPIDGAGSMPRSYTKHVDELAVGEDSIGCGLATALSVSVTTSDVAEDPEWDPLVDLAEEHDFRGCWSFPIETRDGEPVGTFAMYFREERNASEQDRALADMVTQTAGIILSRHFEAQERARAEGNLREMTGALERLTDAGQELIEATPETIRDRTTDIVLSVLDVEYATLWCYDESSGELEAHASGSSSEFAPDAIGLPEGLSDQAWQTFIGDTVDVDNDVDAPVDDPDDGRESPSIRSRMLVPLGRHGVLCAGSTRANAFDDQAVDLAETVATTVETAWDRAESEAELAQQNEELTYLDQLNTLIRGVDQALVAADTVETIDETVCERLAESALYEFAWIGEYDAETGCVEARAWAGVDGAYLHDLTVEDTDSDAYESPFMTTVRTGELQVVADVATDPRAVPWREETLERGGRSCLCIPLAYDDSVYGVLAVYGETPHRKARDTEVLVELGRTVGHAIHAVETRDSLRTDTVYELTLQSSEADTPLCRLSRKAGCVIDFEGQVPGADGLTTVFFTVRGMDSDEFVAASEGSIAVDDLVRLDERDDGVLYKARLVEPMLAALFIEAGASVRSLVIDAGAATAVVDVPDTTAVSTFLTAVRESVPDLELMTRRTRSRSLETDLTLRSTFEAKLTPRQREVIQLAYRSGFFESPRLQTGKELSEALDLAQSTFNYHLRGAQRTLLELLFEPAEATS